MIKLILEIIKEPDKMPNWLTERVGYLLPKTKETINSKNLQTNHMPSHNLENDNIDSNSNF